MNVNSGREHYQKITRIREELRKWIVGMDELIDMLLVCLLARGHILTEGRVGEGKTKTLDAFARVVGGERFQFSWSEENEVFELEAFKRIQFTPDRLPESLTRVVRQRRDGTFEFLPGPLFAHFILGDELNRASERTRSPLLEAMEEGRVTIDNRTYVLPQPYMVLATVNPTDTEGVYKLGAAQSDRLLMKVYTKEKSEEEEIEIVANRRQREHAQIESVASREEIIKMQEFVADNIYISMDLITYVVRLVRKARKVFDSAQEDDKTQYGPSGSRPSLGLAAASKALAFLRGEDYVSKKLIDSLVPKVFRHRIGLGYGSSRGDLERKIQEVIREVSRSEIGWQEKK